MVANVRVPPIKSYAVGADLKKKDLLKGEENRVINSLSFFCSDFSKRDHTTRMEVHTGRMPFILAAGDS
jgi:hypothetical protein